MTTSQPEQIPLSTLTAVKDAPTLAEPPTPKALVPGIIFGGFGMFFASLTPMIVSIAIRVAQIDPEGKTLGLSVIIGAGAVAGIVSTPIFGSLSDRTTGRFGRRRPWLVLGMIVALAGVLIVGFAPSVQLAALGSVIAQVGFSASGVAFLSIIPDMVPDHLRGRVSGGIGLVTALAVLTGIAFVSQLASSPVLMMAVPGVVGLISICTLAFVIRHADRSAVSGSFPRYSPKEFASSFWINPRTSPDFAWNVLSRFFFGIALYGMTTYAVYFLVDGVGLDITAATSVYTQATLITTPISICLFVLSGWLSDKLGRRKAFAATASMILAAGFLVAAITQSVEGFVIAMILNTVGQAVYLTVDLAIAAEVIDDPKRAAKAMSVYQMFCNLPSLIVPIIGAVVLVGLNNNYAVFFPIISAFAVLGGIAVLFVKRVR